MGPMDGPVGRPNGLERAPVRQQRKLMMPFGEPRHVGGSDLELGLESA
jgi:hypothetical protein